ncbi:dihydrolipoamide dehydrogenase [Obelidium mucronatum]|nr:dihydrolipoamide dehydrogenase [Obelidium mucronatum]
MTGTQHFDVIVIGSGSGTKLIRPVANLGYKVAVIEKDAYGGTCLNRGCIPSKMLIHPADVITTIKTEAPKLGIHLSFDPSIKNPISINQKTLVSRVCSEIDKDSESIGPMYDRLPNITRFDGTASFIGPKKIRIQLKSCVASDTSNSLSVVEISGDRIFVATGCHASVPTAEIPGLAGTPYMTYREILRNPIAYESMIVIGGGYIACELGYYAARVGNTKVTFLVREKMLRGEDEEIRKEFEKEFSREFDVRIGYVVVSVRYEEEGGGWFHVTIECKETKDVQVLKSRALFVAAGVQADVESLGLELTGVKTTKQGFIDVDHRFETACPRIYAFGDVIGRYLFKHAANFEGEWLFKTLFAPPQAKGSVQKWTDENGGILYPPIPHAVFSSPQIGGVGLTEQQAQQKYTPEGIIVGRCDVADVAMGAALMATSGFIKLIFSRVDKRLVGAHMIGEQASVVIHMAIAYMHMKATLDDLMDTIYIHPALVEVLRDAARDAVRQFNEKQ